MILSSLLISVAAAANQPAPSDYSQISRAIAAGRLDQARAMVLAAVEGGASGDPLEHVLADLDDASGHCERAGPRYAELRKRHAADAQLAEQSAISALKCGNLAEAEQALASALALPNASWRGWNAKVVLSDTKRDWSEADRAYAQAARLAPDSAEVANNRGWSLLLRGRWSDALPELESAARLAPKSTRTAANLELARTALSADLPSRRPGESDADWSARLNDAGVLAQLAGDRKKAIAAFSQAIEARSEWFERAANNLKVAEARP
ncbi:MAG: hypothetical protein ABIQ32_07975 [Sphingomicrobium sp.]